MRVIGVCLGHDSSVCLVEDGRVIRHFQEERFNRLKSGVNSAIRSLHACLGDLKPQDIDVFAVSDGLRGMTKSHFEAMFKAKTSVGIPLKQLEDGFQIDNISMVPHHECHAASAYYTSGFDKSLIITIDGIGESTTELVSEGVGKKMRSLYEVRTDGIMLRNPDGTLRRHQYKRPKIYSIGWFYSMVTEALGWRMICDEGKTMGLAPYGDPSVIPLREMQKPMFFNELQGFYHNDGKVNYHFGGADEYVKLAKKYGRENLAASAQNILEDKVVRFVKKWVRRTGHKNLCTAGGVFLNVKVNQRIAEECGVNYCPFPLASDVGVSVGAALHAYWVRSNDPYPLDRITNIYWGDEWSNEQIEAILQRNKIQYERYKIHDIANALANGKIIARFEGRMESGPRALGNRSILMSPLKAENKDIINQKVKFREGFRPFCPSVTAEAADRYFDGGGPFMITACNVKTDDIPAVTHVDKTARPQILKREDNPKYYDLIEEFGKITGHPVLLNTSLNIMGQPIVRTPEEAIQCFYGNGLDVLVIGDFMVKKETSA